MITGVDIINRGSGYFDYPNIQIAGGGGSGAEVVGEFEGGELTGVTIVKAGSGYTSVPEFKVYSGIALVDVIKLGTGYHTPPQVTAVGGGGVGASFRATVES